MGGQAEQVQLKQAQWLTKWGDLWCTYMHAAPRWPIHGHYDCAACGRRFLVPWEAGFGHALAAGIRK